MSWSAPEDWSRWDPDRLLVCPYDEVHMIKAKRFQHHLLKCRKNHPEKDFVTCPFNAKHVMLRPEFRHHVSRCPDRSVIEQYNYRGSEKDEDGFYFKGNTSVPSYHKSEDIKESSESWDTDEDSNLQWTEHNHSVNEPQWNQGTSQASLTVTDTLSLSPEEREKFKRQMRREAALRNANSGMQLPSQRLASSQGHNRNSNSSLLHHALSSNVEQDTLSKSSMEGTLTAQNTAIFRNTASNPRNPIFEYCVQRMQINSERPHEDNFEENQIGVCRNEELMNDINVVRHGCANENVFSQHPCNTVLTSSTQYEVKLRGDFANSGMENSSVLQFKSGKRGEDTVPSSQYRTDFAQESPAEDLMKMRTGFIESEMEEPLRSEREVTKPGVFTVSSVCGQPTYPTFPGANGPNLAGVGRAKHLAEARKNNFGGIGHSPPKSTGSHALKTASVGRGRGMLNYFSYSS